MKKTFKNMMRRMLLAGTGLVTLAACNPEPDESDLYTFTGETIESFIAQDSTLTAFNYILTRVGYDKMLSTYGSYTCFAPTNDGVMSYIDSLYNDPEAAMPHNGMTENSLEGLTDSLCLNISKFHISTTYRNLVSMTGSGEIPTMLGYEFQYTSETGNTVLAQRATILNSDNETINGLVHIIDNVIPRTDIWFDALFDRNADDFSLFGQALKATGLVDSLMEYTRGDMEYKQLFRDGLNGSPKFYPANGVGTTGTMECRVGFTIFAEPDEVIKSALQKEGFTQDFDGLVQYANKVYANAPEWYDYMRERKLEVKTDNNYTDRFNALNMFVAYHIVKAKMSINWLVYEKGSNSYWNFAPDADPYDYYETMLPHTIMKIWEPHNVGTGKSLFINRYQTFNTLTNELASPGTNHKVEQVGVNIIRQGSLEATNGWIHQIGSMLVYDEMVPKGVLKERMRVNCTSLFPELITNRIRNIATSDGQIPSGYDGSRHGIPAKYFENMIHYNDNVCLAYCVHGAWRCWESDQMQFWGTYDLAFKLPPVPTDVYEIRVVYAPMSYGSFMQYYIGNSSSVSSMMPIGLPFDATVPVEDPRVGLTNVNEEDDMGIATDIAMHNRGFMRGPYSYCGHAESTGWTTANNGRFEWGTSMTVRYVLGTVELKQGDENWLRIKTLNPDKSANPVGLDFVELVPTSVLANQQYTEDWY